jgi:hypothetical protein
MNTTTPQQITAAIMKVKAVADAIRELGQVPSGHLFAQLSSALDITEYEAIIRTLKNAGLVSESAHLLRWVGPGVTDAQIVREEADLG